MYKVGILMMGKAQEKSPSRVKQIILEVEFKTQISDIFSYLQELNKVKNTNLAISLERGGSYIHESSTIHQVLKNTHPIKGVIKLYLYELLEESTQKIHLKQSKVVISNPEEKEVEIRKVEEVEGGGFCCC